MYTITVLVLAGLSPRCVGFVSDLEKAQKIVEDNACDIFDHVYSHAVIEEYPEGVYPDPKEIAWYKMDYETGKVAKVDKPDDLKCTVNFAMG